MKNTIQVLARYLDNNVPVPFETLDTDGRVPGDTDYDVKIDGYRHRMHNYFTDVQRRADGRKPFLRLKNNV